MTAQVWGQLLVRNDIVGAEDKEGSLRPRGGHGTGDRRRAGWWEVSVDTGPPPLGPPHCPHLPHPICTGPPRGGGETGVDLNSPPVAPPPRVSQGSGPPQRMGKFWNLRLVNTHHEAIKGPEERWGSKKPASRTRWEPRYLLKSQF